MKAVFASAGHSTNPRRDRGAAGNGFVEGILAAEFRQLFAAELWNRHKIRAITDGDDSILADTLRWLRGKTSPQSIVIDIHFNSSVNSGATGTETLIPAQNTQVEREIARRISVATSQILGIPLRGNHAGIAGVKSELESHHGRLGFMRVTGQNILTEICFISNINDITRYQANKNRLATAYADIIKDYVK